jgi:hypothetical protein
MHGLEALTFTPHLGSQLPVAGRGPDQNSPVNCRLSTVLKTVCDILAPSLLYVLLNYIFGKLVEYRYGEYSGYQGKLPQGT